MRIKCCSCSTSWCHVLLKGLTDQPVIYVKRFTKSLVFWARKARVLCWERESPSALPIHLLVSAFAINPPANKCSFAPGLQGVLQGECWSSFPNSPLLLLGWADIAALHSGFVVSSAPRVMRLSLPGPLMFVLPHGHLLGLACVWLSSSQCAERPQDDKCKHQGLNSRSWWRAPSWMWKIKHLFFSLEIPDEGDYKAPGVLSFLSITAPLSPLKSAVAPNALDLKVDTDTALNPFPLLKPTKPWTLQGFCCSFFFF